MAFDSVSALCEKSSQFFNSKNLVQISDRSFIFFLSFFTIDRMETVVKVSRTVTSGVYRIFMKGARRVLAAIPLLGFSADEIDDTTDKSVTVMGLLEMLACWIVLIVFIRPRHWDQ